MRRMTDLGRDRVLVSSDFGDYALLSRDEADALQAGGQGLSPTRRMDLAARGLTNVSGAVPDLDEAVRRTRKAFLLEGPTLHIFVVTLRCDHSCHYCQVSRAAVGAAGFDMSLADAEAALDRVFEAPGRDLTIEFQGGEPALRFDLVRHIVLGAKSRNADGAKALRFTMVSTLHHLGEAELAFCAEHEIQLSTSIDGASALHDHQRPNPSRDAWARTVEGIGRARAALGEHAVAALPTVTRAALNDPHGLVDTYRALGLRSIFLRPVSPYGFARKTARVHGYSTAEFLAFYAQALDYILKLSAAGEAIEEVYAAMSRGVHRYRGCLARQRVPLVVGGHAEVLGRRSCGDCSFHRRWLRVASLGENRGKPRQKSAFRAQRDKAVTSAKAALAPKVAGARQAVHRFRSSPRISGGGPGDAPSRGRSPGMSGVCRLQS